MCLDYSMVMVVIDDCTVDGLSMNIKRELQILKWYQAHQYNSGAGGASRGKKVLTCIGTYLRHCLA